MNNIHSILKENPKWPPVLIGSYMSTTLLILIFKLETVFLIFWSPLFLLTMSLGTLLDIKVRKMYKFVPNYTIITSVCFIFNICMSLLLRLKIIDTPFTIFLIAIAGIVWVIASVITYAKVQTTLFNELIA